MSKDQLNECQLKAMGALESGRNVFVTGAAGTGKSHLTRHFLRGKGRFNFPVVASTGVAALIIGGRTFHSFFGIGTMNGAPERIVAEAVAKDKVVSRIKMAKGILIDEISMIPGTALDVAEEIARKIRGSAAPWGGLQVIVVGDFRQLPPVTQSGGKDWCFDTLTWARSDFYPVRLLTPMRAENPLFIRILNHIRAGIVSPEVTDFLNRRKFTGNPAQFDGTRLFGRRAEVDSYNFDCLRQLPGEEQYFHTVYWGVSDSYKEQIRKNAPIGTMLRLKPDALVMIRINDPDLRWVNGSIGRIKNIGAYFITVELLNGEVIELEQHVFSMKDGGGDEVATATNFPLNLAYATTIHKSQGCTLDRMVVDLTELWEPGQAYVALSRARNPDSLYVTDWSPSSIRSDRAVTDFHKRLFSKEN